MRRLLLLTSTCLLIACAESAPRIAEDAPPRLPVDQRSAPARVIAAERRIPVTPGTELLIPLRPADSAREYLASEPWTLTAWGIDEVPETLNAWRPDALPTITLADGRVLPTRLHWLEVDEVFTDDWLGIHRRWTRRTWEEVQARPRLARAGLGLWLASVNVPADAAGLTARMDGRPLPLVWLEPPPEISDIRRSPRHVLSREQAASLAQAIEPALADPMQAWQAHLLRDRTDPWRRLGSTPPTPADPVIDAWARPQETRWRVALHRLGEEDPALASELVNRLTAAAQLPGEVDEPAVLPLWPGRRSGVWEVLDSLLHPALAASARREAVVTWLKRMPGAACWVIDDTGGQHPTGVQWTTTALTDLTGRDGVASAAPGSGASSTSTMLAGHESTVFSTLLPVAEASAVETVRLRGVATVRDLRIIRGHLPVTPPGLRLGPLVGRWTAPGLLTGATGPPLEGPRTAALVQRGADGGWELYIECEVEASSVGSGADVVRVYFGPRGSSSHVIALDASGGAVLERRRGSPTIWTDVTMEQGPEVWKALLPLPANVVQRDGTLLLGLTRFDSAGRLTSWPRPMYPGQGEPGRVVIDLNYWMSLAP